MADERDIAKEDLEMITSLRNDYALITSKFGHTEVELHLMEKRLNDLHEFKKNLINEYQELQTREAELVKAMSEKYGEGVIDLDSSKFIPSK
jgi:hypothetical protein